MTALYGLYGLSIAAPAVCGLTIRARVRKRTLNTERTLQLFHALTNGTLVSGVGAQEISYDDNAAKDQC
jgi:hypothetical protein